MSLLKHFDRLYVINLPYKQDRRERIERHLEEVGLAVPADITWVRAVSGDACWPPAWFEAGGGAWGCLQSHLRIAQDATMDGLTSYCVLEDDAFFCDRSLPLLERLMRDVPDDWGQLYLGGQHLKEPEPLSEHSFVARCHNVNRTHAFALHQRAFARFQQHISHAPDYIQNAPWHIDHQLGLAHERKDWCTYAPLWWLAGQEEGSSNISGRQNPRLWWQPARYSRSLPFIHLGRDPDGALLQEVSAHVHFGNSLKGGTKEDIGLDACVHSPEKLDSWLEMISREAIDMGMLPGIHHTKISLEQVSERWAAGVFLAGAVDLAPLMDYPFNGLFDHPATSGFGQMLRTSSAA